MHKGRSREERSGGVLSQGLQHGSRFVRWHTAAALPLAPVTRALPAPPRITALVGFAEKYRREDKGKRQCGEASNVYGSQEGASQGAGRRAGCPAGSA